MGLAERTYPIGLRGAKGRVETVIRVTGVRLLWFENQRASVELCRGGHRPPAVESSHLFFYDTVFVVQLKIRTVLEFSLHEIQHFILIQRHIADGKTGILVLVVIKAKIAVGCSVRAFLFFTHKNSLFFEWQTAKHSYGRP